MPYSPNDIFTLALDNTYIFYYQNGIEINKKNLRQNLQFKTFKIDSSITNLEHFAKHIKSTVSLIKDFNPWLLRDIIINPERKRYDIKIPKKNSEEFKNNSSCEHRLLFSEASIQ